MKAIVVREGKAIDNPNALVEIETDQPSPGPHDVLVKVSAISINPVDTKVRSNHNASQGDRILGWDACGEVIGHGDQVTDFQIHDRVYYAGDLTRPGCYAQYQAVDARLVAKAPENLNDAQAAALPLTAITAWEALFDRLKVTTGIEGKLKRILVIGGAGGVGSIALQLLKAQTRMQVITTASRLESKAHCQAMGADLVVNWKELEAELNEHGIYHVDYILNCNDTDQYWEAMCRLIKPQGKICGIVDNKAPLMLNMLKPKSAQYLWEFMFTRALHQTEDMSEQGQILHQVADLCGQGLVTSTLTQTLHGLTVDNLISAHAEMESGRAIGKVTIKL